jgi:murein DD-endopeptidase MepM/ murein hydrolase activator NlpD
MARRLPRTLLALTVCAPIVLVSFVAGSPLASGAGRRCDKVGTDHHDRLVGGDRGQVICGRGGNDVLIGRGGNDVLVGGRGNDKLEGDSGDDTLNGGKGTDECRQNHGHGPSRACEKPFRNPLHACPVHGGNVLDNFGDPRPGGRTHEGVDILAGKGTPIHAPFAGKTEHDGGSLSGRAVYVHGRHGFVYNAHLSRFEPEGKVETGDVIGYVGSTGNAGSTNHDHFEWHPGGGKARDPYDLVIRACRG